MKMFGVEDSTIVVTKKWGGGGRSDENESK
jgi:hypothetical protein